MNCWSGKASEVAVWESSSRKQGYGEQLTVMRLVKKAAQAEMTPSSRNTWLCKQVRSNLLQTLSKHHLFADDDILFVYFSHYISVGFMAMALFYDVTVVPGLDLQRWKRNCRWQKT